jgi:hypothetical protein
MVDKSAFAVAISICEQAAQLDLRKVPATAAYIPCELQQKRRTLRQHRENAKRGKRVGFVKDSTVSINVRVAPILHREKP